MPSWIEFHDSTLTAITHSDAERDFVLDAYVHRWELVGNQWRGTGWEQPVRIRMHKARALSNVPDLPVTIADGELRTTGLTPGTLVPLPFESQSDFSLFLQFVGGGVIDITGRGVCVEAQSSGRFIEDLPEEMRPNAG